jgi:type IV pilus assembly protein PilB
MDVEALQPDFSVLKVIPKAQAMAAKALIFDKDWATLAILTTNEKPDILQSLLTTFTDKKLKYKLYYTDGEAFDKALLWYDQMQIQDEMVQKQLLVNATATGKSAEKLLSDLYTQRNAMDDGQFVNEIIRLTFQAWASDLHFQPQVDWILMRMRKDGVMKPLLKFTIAEFKKYLLKIKFMAGTKMNIDYMPQDGRFDFMVWANWEQKKIDVRVSVMPWLRWEWIVMRYLDSQDSFKTFVDLWFSDPQVEVLKRQLHQNYGMILVTWPTWSWKTTTLYSMLNYLNLPGKKIITLEDPVEYEMAGVEQSQINATKWYTFEEGLKSVLRHDPDIIMVWEIRTAETAEIAFNAALTWHLVIATIHTNTAAEAVTRLLNLGIKPYMLAPALNLIVGQRLLRKLHTCMTWRNTSDAEFHEINNVLTTIHDIAPRTKIEFENKVPHAVWCDGCQTDGYQGRVAAVELLELTTELRQMIVNEKSSMEIYWAIRQWGFLTMKEDAYMKMLDGKTTLDEIRRVL